MKKDITEKERRKTLILIDEIDLELDNIDDNSDDDGFDTAPENNFISDLEGDLKF